MAGNDMTAPFVLSLIGGILVLLNGLVSIAMGALGGAMFGAAAGTDAAAAAALAAAFAGPIMAIMIASGVVALIFGIVMIVGGMRIKNGVKAKNWAIAVLVLSIISFFVGGGFIIGAILGIIGGAIGISKAK